MEEDVFFVFSSKVEESVSLFTLFLVIATEPDSFCFSLGSVLFNEIVLEVLVC